MPNRLPSQLSPPIAFAHRGGRAHAPDNTMAAFRKGLELGATGLESDVWLTADGIPVLDHDGLVGKMRRRPISRLARADLPPHVPALADLYDELGSAYQLSLDMKDPAAVDAAVALARAAGPDAAAHLWLCHHDWRVLATWRERFPDVKLVDSTRLRSIREGPERRAAELAKAGIDAVNLHYSDWSGGLTTLFHRFGVCAFAWDAQMERVLVNLVDMGIDGLYCDHVDRMVDAITRSERGQSPPMDPNG
jgi:glycerophosphoryl diester phosphodiesterase